jgi:chromosome segregation ATPase
MKKYIVFLVIPLLFSCGRADRERAQVLQARTDSLMSQTSQKDLAINDFMKSVNDIQGMLDSIKTKENIINQSTQNGGEMKVSVKQHIMSDISSIYALMLKNKRELGVLSSKLKSSGKQLAEFQKLIDHLQQETSDKDAELKSLQDKLASMNIQITDANQKIDNLNNVVQTQNNMISTQYQTINDQTTTLNTAYYIIGTTKQLKEEKIIKGGKVLADFNRNLFTRVDIRNVKEIPVDKKKVKVLSNHPSDSYKLMTEGKEVKSLEVTNRQAFWSNTKYLVLVTD